MISPTSRPSTSIVASVRPWRSFLPSIPGVADVNGYRAAVQQFDHSPFCDQTKSPLSIAMELVDFRSIYVGDRNMHAVQHDGVAIEHNRPTREHQDSENGWHCVLQSFAKLLIRMNHFCRDFTPEVLVSHG